MTTPSSGSPPQPPDPLDALMVESIDLALQEIRETLARYVIMPDAYLDFLPVWVAHTYCMSVLPVTPYIVIHSPSMRSGKTRLLEILEQFCWKGWLVSDLSGPSIFRKLKEEQVTMLIDEVDAMRLPERTRNVLNTGYRAGGKVPRLNSKNEPEEYPTFGAKVFAGIGKKPLPSTIMDRSIPLMLLRKRKDEHVEPFRVSDLRGPSKKVQDALIGLPMIFGKQIAAPRTDMPAWMSDRKRETLECLYNIAELVGWKKRFAAACDEILHDDDYDDDVDDATLLLHDIREVFTQLGVDRLGGEELRLALRELPDPRYTGDALGNLHRLAFELRKFMVRPVQLWIPDPQAPKGGRNVRGYTAKMFEDSYRRYLD